MSPTPSNRPPRSLSDSLRNSPERRPPLWTGRFSVFAGLEFPTRNGRSKSKRPVRHRFAPIRLKSTFEALRREGSDFTDLQFALAGHVCATRTLNAVRVRRPGKSERLHPTGNAPPSHHSSVTLNLLLPCSDVATTVDARLEPRRSTHRKATFSVLPLLSLGQACFPRPSQEALPLVL